MADRMRPEDRAEMTRMALELGALTQIVRAFVLAADGPGFEAVRACIRNGLLDHGDTDPEPGSSAASWLAAFEEMQLVFSVVDRPLFSEADRAAAARRARRS